MCECVSPPLTHHCQEPLRSPSTGTVLPLTIFLLFCLRFHAALYNVNSTSFANGTDVCTRLTCLPCTRRDTNQEPCSPSQPHLRFSIHTTAFFHTTNFELLLSFVLSVRNRLATPPLLHRILYSAFNYNQDTGWKTGEARFHYRQGYWILSYPQSLRPTQPAHAVGPLDYFPDGKAAGSWSWPHTSVCNEVKNACSCTSPPPYAFMMWWLKTQRLIYLLLSNAFE
jgi:hypothetical protein